MKPSIINPFTFSQQAQQHLYNEQILFEVKNNGIQLVVEGPECYIDYYPSTGKWVARSMTSTKVEGFGLNSLMNYCKKLPEIQEVHNDYSNPNYDPAGDLQERIYVPTTPNPNSYNPAPSKNRLIGTK